MTFKFNCYIITLFILSTVMILGSVGSTPDYYKMLELNEDCSQEDVKKAFRRLARKYHPDKCKEPDAEQKFQKIGEAHEILSDPEKRQQYDHQRKFGGSYQPHTTFNFHSFNFDDLFSEFEDLNNFQGQFHTFGGNRFKIFSDFPDLSNLNFGFGGKRDFHKFGGGDSYFGQHFGASASSTGGSASARAHSQSGSGASSYAEAGSGSGSYVYQSSSGNCKTVTKREGNTYSTVTTCN